MKKINKKGFTLLEVLTSIIIITILMMITLPLINSLSKKNSNELYHSYEKMMEEYVIAGQNKNKETVLLSEIDGLDQIKKECKGYVSISQDNPPIYKAYIKCGDKYTTENYGDLYECVLERQITSFGASCSGNGYASCDGKYDGYTGSYCCDNQSTCNQGHVGQIYNYTCVEVCRTTN